MRVDPSRLRAWSARCPPRAIASGRAGSSSGAGGIGSNRRGIRSKPRGIRSKPGRNRSKPRGNASNRDLLGSDLDLQRWNRDPFARDRDRNAWNRDLSGWGLDLLRGDRDSWARDRDRHAWNRDLSRGDRDLCAWGLDYSGGGLDYSGGGWSPRPDPEVSGFPCKRALRVTLGGVLQNGAEIDSSHSRPIPSRSCLRSAQALHACALACFRPRPQSACHPTAAPTGQVETWRWSVMRS